MQKPTSNGAARCRRSGATIGNPAGALPPPGFYVNVEYVNGINGVGTGQNSAAQGANGGKGATSYVNVVTPALLWSTGWNFLGGSVGLAVIQPFYTLDILESNCTVRGGTVCWRVSKLSSSGHRVIPDRGAARTVSVGHQCWMDAPVAHRDNPAMGRYLYTAYDTADTPRYIVVWDLHWHVIEYQHIEPGRDLNVAMQGTLKRLAGEGWQPESDAEYGFAFIRNGEERRLLMLTPRDPNITTLQSFSPDRPAK